MLFWDQCVDVLRESIFAYALVFNGNLGAGILAVTFLAKLALLPLAVRMVRAAQVQQRAMQRLQPQLDALRAQHKADRRRLAEDRDDQSEHQSPSAVSETLALLLRIQTRR